MFKMNKFPKSACVVFLFVFLFVFPFQDFLFAENLSKKDKLNEQFFINFKNDFTDVLVSPTKWKKKDFLNLSAVLGAGFLLYSVDQDIHQWFQDNRSSSSDDFFNVLSFFGHGGAITGLIAALYAAGELSHNNSLRKTALLSLESWLTTGIIVTGLKCVTGRARPNSGESSHSFYPLAIKSRYYSFPSGHASSAFAVATTIARQSEKLYVDILAYSLATLVAISRVHNNKHWPSDVLVGASIGYFVAKKINTLDRKRNSSKMNISFQFSHQRQAISITFVF